MFVERCYCLLCVLVVVWCVVFCVCVCVVCLFVVRFSGAHLFIVVYCVQLFVGVALLGVICDARCRDIVFGLVCVCLIASVRV